MKAKGYSFTTVSGALAKQRAETANAGAGAGAGAGVGVGAGAGAQAGEQLGGQGTNGQDANGQQPGAGAGTGAGLTSTAVEQAAHRKATGTTLYEGKALIAAVAFAEWSMPALASGLVVVGVAVMGRFGMMLILARAHYRQRNRRRFSWGPEVTRPVSVIVPAYNEKECIDNTINSLAKSTHPIEITSTSRGSPASNGSTGS